MDSSVNQGPFRGPFYTGAILFGDLKREPNLATAEIEGAPVIIKPCSKFLEITVGLNGVSDFKAFGL